MKRIQYFFIIIVLLIQNICSLQAQNTEGTEFWLTYSQSLIYQANFLNVSNMQIRIVCGELPTTGKIYFTHLNDSVIFNMSAYEVYDYTLDLAQKLASYNVVSMGITNYSIHITTSYPVSVYALKNIADNTDVTNLLPVTALGDEYYQISYSEPITSYQDAYAVVATQNNTLLYHNGDLAAPLEKGQVYYRVSSDMTGARITATKPIAFFRCINVL